MTEHSSVSMLERPDSSGIWILSHKVYLLTIHRAELDTRGTSVLAHCHMSLQRENGHTHYLLSKCRLQTGHV